MMTMPLEGIRVVDWSAWQQGPVASMMLGDLGADVIKIENREGGDPSRGIMGTGGNSFNLAEGRHAYIEAHNRNKRSITLDLKKDEGREVMYRLVKEADVFIQNFRQDVPVKLGLDYKTLSGMNPRLVYGSASPWGPDGPESDQRGYDYLGQARSGFMSAVGEPDMAPLVAASPIADQVGAVMLAYGVMAALISRNSSGKGQEVNASLLGSMIWLQALSVNTKLLAGWEMPRQERSQTWNPVYCHYKCADGRWIALGLLQSDRYWADFCKALEIEELETDPRFQDLMYRAVNSTELVPILEARFASKSSEEWGRILKKADLLFCLVNSIADLPSDPQVTANDYITEYDHPALGKVNMVGFPIHMSETPPSVRMPAPEMGQHTEDVLLELGYTWEDIGRFRDEEVI